MKSKIPYEQDNTPKVSRPPRSFFTVSFLKIGCLTKCWNRWMFAHCINIYDITRHSVAFFYWWSSTERLKLAAYHKLPTKRKGRLDDEFNHST